MSVASAFRSRFTTIRHTIPASTPSFRLACNLYHQVPSANEASNAATPPPMIFTHANGFHKEIWEPVISRLNPRWSSGDMYAIDCRNQGDSAVLNKDILPDTFDWYWYATDILRVVDTFGLKKPIGVGHSFGASAFILAELLRPGTFSAIVAVDPTMFPRSMYMNAPLEDHPMGQITLKRRDTWKDRVEAKAKMLKSSFFQAWHPEALDLYTEHGLLDVVNDDGSTRVVLKCPKFQEAITFACVGSGLHDAFERLNELTIPVHIIAGEDSDINQPELVQMKLEQCQHGSADVIKNTGHLVSLENPQETANSMSAFLDRIYSSQKADEGLKARL
ncbi:MAG: Alpha/beta hydrolase family-domain-containing protein [Benniella sp.]|nr:MAG: Alpha/beta hydrolase family-domain-containing protein [Benniella sp.]